MTRKGLSPKIPQNRPLSRAFRNTAEPSGELSVGDVVAVGEAGLAVGRAGWTPIRGDLNEVRTSQHGTRPLPASAPAGTAPGKPRTAGARRASRPSALPLRC
jgi:hypothetical protein